MTSKILALTRTVQRCLPRKPEGLPNFWSEVQSQYITNKASSVFMMDSFKRYGVWLLCILLFVTGLLLAENAWHWCGVIFFGALSALGIYDFIQKDHAIPRNYPITGNIRYMIEAFRPEMRQYWFESDSEQLPFSRRQRSLVYARAKQQMADRPFGTQENVYGEGYECIGHSLAPKPPAPIDSFRIEIGGPACRQPYRASIFNISAMSFGSLSANAIRALNGGAARGNFYHDTGEGGISPYHREHSGDLVWEIGSGYFGCRDHNGYFSAERFAEQAHLPQVKMIEIKLSQGAKPGHGGILPKHKITDEIATTRDISKDRDCVSPASHSAFSTPLELLQFVQQLRELSAGKPVGFKLCIGQGWEFMGIVKAMLASGITTDFIVVDGAEGGTGAAPLEFADHLGMPLREALVFVHNTLLGTNLRDKIKIGASGKVISAFDILRLLALGADWVNAARAFMFALGCIQSLSCHTNRCPTGIATQDPSRQRALDPADKIERVYHYHRATLQALSEMIAAAGLSHPSQVSTEHLLRRISQDEVKLYSQLFQPLAPGELLQRDIGHPFYAQLWLRADAEYF